MRNATVVILTLVLTALVAVGCGKKMAEKITEKAIETAAHANGEDVDVDIDADTGALSMSVKSGDGTDQKVDIKSSDGDFSMTMAGEDGGMSVVGGASAKIPEDFPKDVPQYKGMEIKMVQTMPAQNMFMVAALSPDPVAKVAAFYKKECAAQGWTEQMQASQEGTQTMIYKKESRLLHVTLATEDDGTGISLHTLAQ